MNLLDIWKRITSKRMLLSAILAIMTVCCCMVFAIAQQDTSSISTASLPTKDINLIYTQAFETAKAQIYLDQTETMVAFPTLTITLTSTITITPTQTLIWG